MEGEIKHGMLWYAVPLFFIGTAGAVLGALGGVLFAPDAGRETRRKLGQWMKERGKKGKVEYEAVREAIDAGRRAFKEKEQQLTGA